VPAVVVSASLDGYVVVAIVEVYILNEQVASHLGVYAVVVDEFGIITQASANDIFATQEVDTPEGTVGDEYTAEGNVLAVVELHELWAQIVTFAKKTLGDGCLLVVLLAQQLLVCLLHGLPLWECLHAVAVNSALAYDGYVLEVFAIDEGTVVIAERALPRCLDHRQIVFWVGGEEQGGTTLQFEGHVAGKVYGTLDVPLAFRHYDVQTSHVSSGTFDGFVEGRLAVCLAVSFGSERCYERLALVADSMTLGGCPVDDGENGVTQRQVVTCCSNLLACQSRGSSLLI